MSKSGKNIPKGYKTSSLGIIPIDWEIKELGKLFEFKNGINAGKESYGSGVKFINIMEIIYNECITPNIITGSVQISDDQKKLYLVKDGDVMFNRTSETPGEIGLTAVYYGNDEVVFGGFVIRGRPIDNSINNDYKKYCFRSKLIRDQIIKSGQGAVRSNIGQGDLEKIKISLPPQKEQKIIANILGTWDKAITKQQKLIYQKQNYRKWLMHELLTGQKRLKGFKETWKEIYLGEAFSERNETCNVDLPLLSIGSKGVYPQSDSIKKDTSNEDKSKYLRICPGDIGYNTMRMWQGRSALSELEGIISPAYTVVTPINQSVSLFYSYLFKTPKVINLFFRSSQGLVDDTLNCKYHNFARIKVKIPPTKEEQMSIANIFLTVDKEIQIIKDKVDNLQEQKKGLMQQLLTGKKRLK